MYVGKYFIEGENTSDYPCINEDDYYYTDFSDYSVIAPNPKNSRIIESKNVYTYKERKRVRYIRISDIVGANGKVNFSEIAIRDKDGRKINYMYICVDCSYDFLTYIKNGIENENKSYILNGGEIMLDLMGYYRFDEFNLELSIYDDTNIERSFDIAYYNSLDGDIMMETTFRDNYKCIDVYDVPTYIIKYTNMILYDVEWENVEQTEIAMSNSYTVEVIKVDTYYRFKDKYVNYYYVKREYSDYMDGANDIYPCQSDEFIEVYRFRTRDMIHIDDYIAITDFDDSLANHIESNIDYEVIGNLDLNHNGTYTVTIKNSFIELNITVYVSKEQNDLLDLYNSLLEDYNELLEKYNDLEDRIINLQTENMIMLDENSMLMIDYNELMDNYMELSELYNNLESSYFEYKENHINLVDDYNVLLEDYIILCEQLGRLQNLNVVNKEDYDNLVTAYQNLQEEYNLININNYNYNSLKETYDILLNNYNEKLNKVEEYAFIIKNNEQEYEDLLNLYNTLLDKYSSIEKSLQEYKEEYEKINKLKTEYETIFSNKDEEIALLMKEKENILLEYQEMTLKYEMLQNDFNNINKDNIVLHNEMIEELNNYKIRINELTYSLEKCERNIDLKEEETNKITKEFENQLINLRMSKDNTEEVIEEEPLPNYNNIILIILTISIIVLLIGFFIKIFYLDKKKN